MTLRERLEAAVGRATKAPPDVQAKELSEVVADWLRERSAEGLVSEARLAPPHRAATGRTGTSGPGNSR